MKRILIIICCLIISNQVAKPKQKQGKTKGIRLESEELDNWKTYKRYALIVGVSAYPRSSGLSSLEYASEDAKKMKIAIEQVSIFDKVILHTTVRL